MTETHDPFGARSTIDTPLGAKTIYRLDALTGFVDSFVPFFAGRSRAYLELRTKSAAIRPLLQHQDGDNLVVAFSFTPVAAGEALGVLEAVVLHVLAVARIARLVVDPRETLARHHDKAEAEGQGGVLEGRHEIAPRLPQLIHGGVHEAGHEERVVGGAGARGPGPGR